MLISILVAEEGGSLVVPHSNTQIRSSSGAHTCYLAAIFGFCVRIEGTHKPVLDKLGSKAPLHACSSQVKRTCGAARCIKLERIGDLDIVCCLAVASAALKGLAGVIAARQINSTRLLLA